jgi:hypothetical protein
MDVEMDTVPVEVAELSEANPVIDMVAGDFTDALLIVCHVAGSGVHVWVLAC